MRRQMQSQRHQEVSLLSPHKVPPADPPWHQANSVSIALSISFAQDALPREPGDAAHFLEVFQHACTYQSSLRNAQSALAIAA